MHFEFLTCKKVILLWNSYKKILAWLGLEPTTSRSEVNHANHYTIDASYKKGLIFQDESYNLLFFAGKKFKMHFSYSKWILFNNSLSKS